MSRAGGEAVERVVLTPEMLGRSLFDPACRQVLESWRDGRVRLVVTRSLLERYLRLLGRMGLSRELLRWWMWWFTSPERAEYLAEMGSPGRSDGELCAEAARLGRTRWIVASSGKEHDGVQRAAKRRTVRLMTLPGFLAAQGEAPLCHSERRRGI